MEKERYVVKLVGNGNVRLNKEGKIKTEKKTRNVKENDKIIDIIKCILIIWYIEVIVEVEK